MKRTNWVAAGVMAAAVVGGCGGGSGDAVVKRPREPPPSAVPSASASVSGTSREEEDAKELQALKAKLPEIIKALNDPDQVVCMQALSDLTVLGPEALRAVPALLKMVTKRTGSTANQCWKDPGFVTREIGAPAIPILVRALGTEDNDAAAWALTGMGPIAIPALVRVLDEGGERAASAADALSKMNAAAAPAVPALVKAYHEKKITLPAFLSAASFIGPGAGSAVPDIIEVIRSGDQEWRREAINTFRCMGSAAKDAIPVLQSLPGEDRAIKWIQGKCNDPMCPSPCP